MMIKFAPVSTTRYGDSNSMDRLTRSFLEARDDLLRFLKRRGRRHEIAAEKALAKEAALQDVDGPGVDLEAQADAAGRLERLSAALTELPPQCRQAFLMNRIDELTHAEIAARLGV